MPQIKGHNTGQSAAVESAVQSIGRRLLDDARARRLNAGTRGGQEERFLDRLMADERVRVQMLRFVDVLPALDDDGDLVSHLEQYLGDDPVAVPLPVLEKIPGLVNWGLRHARSGLASHVVGSAVRAAVGRLAKRFIAGQDPDSAVKCLHRLHKAGMGFTLDLLGEATVSEAEAQAYQARYLALLDELSPRVTDWQRNDRLETVNGRPCPRLNLSIKVTALYWQLDPVDEAGSAAAVKERLRPILRAAIKRGAFITLDMEQYDARRITLRVFRELLTEPEFADWPDAGIAVQAYLRDTEADIDELIAWARRRGAPVTVRLVRGAYWDYETVIAAQNRWPVPVWTRKRDTDRCYETCLRKLMSSLPYVETAVATHNVRSLAMAMALARSLDLSPQQYEMQMLYGMADAMKDVLVSAGQRLRIYAPFGELLPGMAYLVRRLLENTSSQSFVRMGFADDEPAESLLDPPCAAPGNGGDVHEGDGADNGAAGASTGPVQWQRDIDAPYVIEPVARFVDASQRRAFTAALETVRGQFGRQYPLIIAGRPRSTDGQLLSINPAQPDEVVGRCASAGEADALAAIEAAQRAFESWGRQPQRQRSELVLRAADVMRRRRVELAAWEVFEAAKPWREADADVAEAIDFLEYYARQMLRMAAGQSFNTAGETNHYFYEPRGVGAVIAPWNFPLAIVTGMTAAAVAAGNTVVMKPAPQTPVIAAKLMEVFHEADLPAGVVNYLPGGDAAGEALVRHAAVHFIAFTGSQSVGCRINEIGARVAPGQDHLKRVIAEMGGKNAIIVDSDADVDDAVRGTVVSAFGYAGQKCSAASRVIVVGPLYEPFLARLIEATRSLRIGPPRDPGAFVPPVIDAEACDRIGAAIAAGHNEARLALTRDVSDLGPGYFVGPTVFADVPPSSALAQEEIFGPVLAVMRAADFDEALRIANGTRYALTGGVWSRSPDHLLRATRRFRVGNLYLNRKITGAVVGRQPFGGFKMSGVGGKAGGPDYLLQFLEPRTVTENTVRRGFAPDEHLAEALEREHETDNDESSTEGDNA